MGNDSQTKTVLFETKVISSERYVNLKWIRYVIYSLLFCLVWIVIRPSTRYKIYDSFAETMGWDFGTIFLLIVICALVGIGLYTYSTDFEEKGVLMILEDRIELVFDEVRFSYLISEIKDFKIERGATYHYQYKDNNYLFEADNWISFFRKGKEIKQEFIIDSEEKNNEFEAMIRFFRKKRIQVTYLSI